MELEMPIERRIKKFLSFNPRYESWKHDTSDDWLVISVDVEALGDSVEAKKALDIAESL